MPRDDSKVIAMATHAPNIPTGFGRVCHEVCDSIGQAYKTYAIGWQFQGKPMQTENYTLCPTAPGGNYNEFGERTFPRALQTLRPHILIGLADYFVWAKGAHGHAQNWLPKFLLENLPKEYNTPSPKWVWYFPVDSAPLNAAFTGLLDLCEYPVTMSKFGYEVCKSYDYDTTLIPHGVNPEVFKPVKPKDKPEMKRRLCINTGCHLPPWNIPPDEFAKKFIFFWGGRNQIRKFPNILVECIGRFFQQTKADDVYVMMHSTVFPGQVGFTLPLIMDLYKLDRKKMTFTNADSIYIPTDDFLTSIMQSCDVYVDSAGGEGFGFFRAESAACGMARILPRWTTGEELMGEEPHIHIEDTYTDRRNDGSQGLQKVSSGFLVPTMEKWANGHGQNFTLIDKQYMVEAMVYCYEHQDETRRMGLNGREHIVDNYRWEKVLPLWHDLMEIVFADIKFIADKERERIEQEQNVIVEKELESQSS